MIQTRSHNGSKCSKHFYICKKHVERTLCTLHFLAERANALQPNKITMTKLDIINNLWIFFFFYKFLLNHKGGKMNEFIHRLVNCTSVSSAHKYGSRTSTINNRLDMGKHSISEKVNFICNIHTSLLHRLKAKMTTFW